ncbi:MAG TPA: glycosyltransferase family 4 protein [Acidimicrobiales bacterium]|nr:glycosyltransferase family 4 protein [Acidimicrobiales bacterium]
MVDAAPARRVLQLLGPSTGGIRRHVAFLAGELEERGWRVDTAGPAGVLDGLRPLDHEVPVPAGFSVRGVPAARRALRRLLARYDIVHAHGLTAGWVAVLTRGFRRRPALVLTIHNVVLPEVAGRSARLQRALERWLPRRVNRVIAVSPAIADSIATDTVVIKAFGAAPTAQNSPASVRTSLGVGAGTPMVVTVARLHHQKGLDVLIAATPEILSAVPGANVVIIGEGGLLTELLAQAAALGVGDAVRLIGPINPAADALAAADVVAIPSRWESGPLVLSEAMLLGRPIVATPVGIVTDLVTDGETGWLVPIDDPGALAHALIAALRDPVEAARRAAAGQVRARAADGEDRVSLVEHTYRASLETP